MRYMKNYLAVMLIVARIALFWGAFFAMMALTASCATTQRRFRSPSVENVDAEMDRRAAELDAAILELEKKGHRLPR